MNRRVTAATPRATGCYLALQLLSGMYSGLSVVNARGQVVDVVTELDLLQAIREGEDLQTAKAEEILSRTVICAREGDAYDDIIAKMTEHHIIRLQVVGENGKLIGLIARADILSRLIEPEFITIVST
jgi:CBS domain-containing protein